MLLIGVVQGNVIDEEESDSRLTKSNEKVHYPKKVTSLKKKPTKSPNTLQATTTSATRNSKTKTKEVLDVFKNLPADDLAFIKELDKQFNKNGGKLKIKIENDNSSDTKNSKRTVDGELGYGYSQYGFDYAQPKYQFYPYSQHDIAPAQPTYQNSHTEVSIEPSFSYELKQHSYRGSQAPHQIDVPAHAPQQQYAAHNYEEPVIVLRIPGPAKYAAHLQALLQQYLEIRAAQYLQILEESEFRKQQQQQQQHQQQYQQQEHQQQHQHQQQEQHKQLHYHQQQQQQQVQHEHEPEQYNVNYEAQEEAYAHQQAPTPATAAYADINAVYQRYKQQSSHPQQQQEDYYTNEAETHYRMPATSYGSALQYYAPVGHSVYFIAMTPQGAYSAETPQHAALQAQPIYVQEDDSQGQPELPVTENNPRHTHTKILFKQRDHVSADAQSQHYALPSISSYEQHVPTSTPVYHQYYEQQQQQVETSVEDDSHAVREVAITQRPYNYHAHGLRSQLRGKRRGSKSTTTERTQEDTEAHLQKIQKFVREKYGAKTGSTVELQSQTVHQK